MTTHCCLVPASAVAKPLADILGRGRAALLAGVSLAGLLLPDPVMADKWSPSLDAIGRAGSDQGGGALDLLVPLYQDDDTLLFGNALGGLDSDSSTGTALGLGLRLQLDESVIVGGYVFGDWLRTSHDNAFFQVTGGLEAMTEDWDLRVTGYLPLTSERLVAGRSAVDGVDGGGQPGVGQGTLALQGNELGIIWQGQPGTPGVNGFKDQEALLAGGEAEVGYKLPLDHTLGKNWEVRTYLGGYYFSAQDYDTFAGPRARIELRAYDLAFLGDGARVTLGAEASWDDPRGVSGAGLLRVRIPLGWFTGERKELTALDRRMVDPIPRRITPFTDQRHEVLTAATGGIGGDFFEAVEADETGNEITSVYFASGTGDGNGMAGDAGTADDPTDLADAVSRAGTGGMVVVLGGAGNLTGTASLLQNQIVIGGDVDVQVSGVTSGAGFTFDADDYSMLASRPTLVSDAAAGTGTLRTTLGSGGTWIQGLDLDLGATALQRIGVYHQDSSDDLVRDVAVIGGLIAFYGESLNGNVANLRFEDISTDGSTVSLALEHGDPPPMGMLPAHSIGNIAVTGASFLNAPSNQPVIQINAGVDGRVTDVTLTDVNVLNSRGTALGLQAVDRVTVRNFQATSAVGFVPGSAGIVSQNSTQPMLLNSDLVLDNVFIDGYTIGLRLLADSNATVTDLAIRNAVTKGVEISNSDGVAIDGATIYGVGTVAGAADLAVQIFRTTNVTFANVAIDGMTHPAMGPGVQVTETGISVTDAGTPGSITFDSAASIGNTTTNIALDCRNTNAATAVGHLTYDDLDDMAGPVICGSP